ncbi:MAG: flavin reductase family protein [Phycisphaerales bacterium]
MKNDSPVDHEMLFEQIPCGLFVLTAAHDGVRCGILTRWVQPCSTKPPLVMVSIATGLPIEPVIRDARSFALCQLPENERILRRRFAEPADRADDQFITIPHFETPSGAPVPERAFAYFDCQLVRHVDLEADHRLYVGKVTSADLVKPLDGAAPAVEVRGVALDVTGATSNGAS